MAKVTVTQPPGITGQDLRDRYEDTGLSYVFELEFNFNLELTKMSYFCILYHSKFKSHEVTNIRDLGLT